MTAAVDRYTSPIVIDPASDADGVARLFTLLRSGSPIEVDVQVFHTDKSGNIVGNSIGGDISALVDNSDDSASVAYDSTAAIPASIRLTIKTSEPFTFGSDQIHVYALIRSANYNTVNHYDPRTWLRFDLGWFVVTSPGTDDLDVDDERQVTGYGLNYRLSKGMRDSYAFAIASKAGDAVTTLMRAAGVLGGAAALTTICDYNGDWYNKTFTTPMSYPLGGAITDYLSAINDILAATGQRAIYSQVNARWMIEAQPDITKQASRYTLAGSPDPLVTTVDLQAKTVQSHSTNYAGDVYDVPNQFIFIQNGLTFEPGGDGATDGSSGLYIINNMDVAPSGQNITGDVRPTVITLEAIGQTDLVTQANAYYANAIAAIETVALSLTPWPVGRHFDIFYFVHSSLPFSSRRRLQAQRWEYFLFGAPTTVASNAVGFV